MPADWVASLRTLPTASTVTGVVGKARHPAVGTAEGPGEDAPRPGRVRLGERTN
jgi:hypothetical protein